MQRRLQAMVGSQMGIIGVIFLLALLLTGFAGAHVDQLSGQTVNNFLNSDNLIQWATETSFFAVMAVGATMVIITQGIDLSVGSIYALAGVTTALMLRNWRLDGTAAVLIGFVLCVGIGTLAGYVNGLMVRFLKVHPFVVTLGTMWVFRGVAFVISRAESILLPYSLTSVAKNNLGLPGELYPVPMLVMFLVTILGSIYLLRTVAGRRVFAVGGNPTASLYSGVPIGRTLVAVYTICGLTAGLASFVGNGYYGSASCGDAQGYELYVIASAVVGGVSLSGGKGSALGAMLGALLIVLIRQSIRLMHFDQNYEWIIIGAAIIVAVVLDRISTNLGERRLTQARRT